MRIIYLYLIEVSSYGKKPSREWRDSADTVTVQGKSEKVIEYKRFQVEGKGKIYTLDGNPYVSSLSGLLKPAIPLDDTENEGSVILYLNEVKRLYRESVKEWRPYPSVTKRGDVSVVLRQGLYLLPEGVTVSGIYPKKLMKDGKEVRCVSVMEKPYYDKDGDLFPFEQC